jgi:hypothetical protein
MSSKKFIINFITSENCNHCNSGRLFEYEANVTTISKSLGLFKVSNICRLGDEGLIILPDVFYLASYPLNNNKTSRWVVPFTQSSSNFISLIGETIEINNHEFKLAY